MYDAVVPGALATTFTASQDLLSMIPNLYQFTGEILTGLFHVALCILVDHQDVMACRQICVALLCSNNPQEAQEMATISHIATIKLRIRMCFLSHIYSEYFVCF